LAGYLVRHGLVAQGAQIVLAEQGNELGRPSLIRCDITSQNGVLSTVRVGGQAVASLKGTIVEA
jgi:trans-2,3-dihydro-3-hydroxyanthranilate isomerase